jgi:hypothetical protein
MRPAIAAMPAPLVFKFLLAKGLHGKAFTKEASLYLVLSAGLLAILLLTDQFAMRKLPLATRREGSVSTGSVGFGC